MKFYRYRTKKVTNQDTSQIRGWTYQTGWFQHGPQMLSDSSQPLGGRCVLCDANTFHKVLPVSRGM